MRKLLVKVLMRTSSASRRKEIARAFEEVVRETSEKSVAAEHFLHRRVAVKRRQQEEEPIRKYRRNNWATAVSNRSKDVFYKR